MGLALSIQYIVRLAKCLQEGCNFPLQHSCTEISEMTGLFLQHVIRAEGFKC